jgi:hypothetical protein
MLPRIRARLSYVLQGGDLRGGKQLKSRRAGVRALRYIFFEEHVVGGVGVEGRVELDQVNAGVRHLAAEDVKIVAKVESVLPVHC